MYLFLRCCEVPIHWRLPFTMMAMRVHRASHSLMLCEVSSTDLPAATTALMLLHTRRLLAGSMPLVGSSWSKITG
jgi:hypothetical protein